MAQDERIPYCPDHPNTPMGKAGFVWFGRQRVQRFRCKINGATTTQPLYKDAGGYGQPNVVLPESEQPDFSTPEVEPYTAPEYKAPTYQAPVYRPKRKAKKGGKSFDDISVGGGINIGDISKGGSIDSMSL